ncbi:putative entry exclusion protein TrbK-alt [Inquilinus sp. CAU 1745]|uniref:putative entry exclusion protein TrbK-alt n=1 Tax=Inquilinus sp. CAU 1745 TaxID=3140369 RepID=UPI00325B9D9F
MRGKPDQILRLIAFGLGAQAMLAAAFEFRDVVAPEPAATAVRDDPLSAELARCRRLAPQEAQTDTACKSAWAENRRRFFAPALTPQPETE